MRILPSVALTLALAACGSDSTAPDGPNPPDEGTYTYRFDRPAAGGFEAHTYTGTLTITSATSDRIEGTWNVPEYEASAGMGMWNNGAYLLYANVPGVATVTHRIARKGNAIECEAGWLVTGGGAGPVNYPGTCTITRSGS